MTKFNVGGKVRYIDAELNYTDMTLNAVYEIIALDSDGDAVFYDDAGDSRNIYSENRHYFELVEEPEEDARQTPVPSLSPELADLLANMSRRLYEVEQAIKPSEAQEDEPSDNVNHPSHYTKGKHETIDIIEHITSGYADPFVAYCVGNTTKYIDRAPYKHGSPSEDLRKAAWYLTKAADYLDAM